MELSPRQKQVAAYVARGYTDRAIARAIGISIKTVQMHVQEAADRLPGGSRRRHKLTVWWLGQDRAA